MRPHCTDVYGEGDAELHVKCLAVKTELHLNSITIKIENKRLVNLPTCHIFDI